MTIPEIEEGSIEFRTVFIDMCGETRVDLHVYHIVDRSHLREMIVHVEETLRRLHRAKNCKTTWKYYEM